jgi:hypothetical protein
MSSGFTHGLVPGKPHEVLIVALREQPALLGTLVAALSGGRLARGLVPSDTAIRFVKPAEVRPDILFRRGRRRWTLVEVQRGIDPRKRRRWLLAVGLLFDQTRTLGDLIVITARASVARWARRVVHLRTALGTEVRLTPVVLHLGEAQVAALLDEAHPELALFAAWAMQHRHGPAAREIVEQAFELCELLPASLRGAQQRAILSVLSERMLAQLREASMNPDKIPETPAARKTRLFLESQGRKRGRAEGLAEGLAKGLAEGEAKGEAKGRREALLTLLRARGLAPSREDEARIRDCTVTAKLDRWIERAATAASVREVLGPKSSAPATRRRARAVGVHRARTTDT